MAKMIKRLRVWWLRYTYPFSPSTRSVLRRQRRASIRLRKELNRLEGRLEEEEAQHGVTEGMADWCSEEMERLSEENKRLREALERRQIRIADDDLPMAYPTLRECRAVLMKRD